MTVAVGLANIAMSFVYLAYGTITLFDLKDGGWRDRTRRQFGLAFLAIMFTCGPHHLEHGLHVLGAVRAHDGQRGAGIGVHGAVMAVGGQDVGVGDDDSRSRFA